MVAYSQVSRNLRMGAYCQVPRRLFSGQARDLGKGADAGPADQEAFLKLRGFKHFHLKVKPQDLDLTGICVPHPRNNGQRRRRRRRRRDLGKGADAVFADQKAFLELREELREEVQVPHQPVPLLVPLQIPKPRNQPSSSERRGNSLAH